MAEVSLMKLPSDESHWNLQVISQHWLSEWLNLTTFLGTANSEVHIVHISCVIIAYTLESLSSLSQITHNLQATVYLKKKDIKNETQKRQGTH